MTCSSYRQLQPRLDSAARSLRPTDLQAATLQNQPALSSLKDQLKESRHSRVEGISRLPANYMQQDWAKSGRYRAKGNPRKRTGVSVLRALAIWTCARKSRGPEQVRMAFRYARRRAGEHYDRGFSSGLAARR
jgi:hypothetical protein